MRIRCFLAVAGSIHGGGGFAVPDNARSHISQMSSRAAAAKRATSIADLTGKPSYPGMASAMGLGLSRPGQYVDVSLVAYIGFSSIKILLFSCLNCNFVCLGIFISH